MRSSTASCTPRTASPSTARPRANNRKNLPTVPILTQTPPRDPLKPSTGATVRDHRNAVRDRSESLSAIDRNHCPHSSESALPPQSLSGSPIRPICPPKRPPYRVVKTGETDFLDCGYVRPAAICPPPGLQGGSRAHIERHDASPTSCACGLLRWPTRCSTLSRSQHLGLRFRP